MQLPFQLPAHQVVLQCTLQVFSIERLISCAGTAAAKRSRMCASIYVHASGPVHMQAGAQVINWSYGFLSAGPVDDTFLRDGISALGPDILFFNSAGNGEPIVVFQSLCPCGCQAACSAAAWTKNGG